MENTQNRRDDGEAPKRSRSLIAKTSYGWILATALALPLKPSPVDQTAQPYELALAPSPAAYILPYVMEEPDATLRGEAWIQVISGTDGPLRDTMVAIQWKGSSLDALTHARTDASGWVWVQSPPFAQEAFDVLALEVAQLSITGRVARISPAAASASRTPMPSFFPLRPAMAEMLDRIHQESTNEPLAILFEITPQDFEGVSPTRNLRHSLLAMNVGVSAAPTARAAIINPDRFEPMAASASTVLVWALDNPDAMMKSPQIIQGYAMPNSLAFFGASSVVLPASLLEGRPQEDLALQQGIATSFPLINCPEKEFFIRNQPVESAFESALEGSTYPVNAETDPGLHVIAPSAGPSSRYMPSNSVVPALAEGWLAPSLLVGSLDEVVRRFAAHVRSTPTPPTPSIGAATSTLALSSSPPSEVVGSIRLGR